MTRTRRGGGGCTLGNRENVKEASSDIDIYIYMYVYVYTYIVILAGRYPDGT